jgi:DUF1365 family protein
MRGHNDSGYLNDESTSSAADSNSLILPWSWLCVVGFSCATYSINRIIGNRGACRDAYKSLLALAFFSRYKILQDLERVTALTGNVWLYLLPLLAVNVTQVLYLSTASEDATNDSPATSDLLLKPIIFPTSTAHTRFFPRRHSFRYSYLLVGVPIGWRGRIGNVLGCDESSPGQVAWWKAPWLSVHAEDYLYYTRDSVQGKGADPNTTSLRDKLDAYLLGENADPKDFPHVYLVTAPKVLGFSFNPVSFWYLYDGTLALKAMILEVNNTFGERRMYLLSGTSDAGQDQMRGTSGVLMKFRSVWDKDFHVSPFNDREGVYSIIAANPFAASSKVVASQDIKINNIVTLSSPRYETLSPEDQGHSEGVASAPAAFSPKIVASITSAVPGISPYSLSMSNSALAKFILQHLWIGFLTNPRILREARKLWGMGLKVWYRPEPKSSTVGREETKEEVVIERIFRQWLDFVVRRASSVEGVRYWPAAGAERGRMIILDGNKSTGSQSHVIVDMKILTPEFYSELVRRRLLLDVWREQWFAAKKEDAMVHGTREGNEVWQRVMQDLFGDNSSQSLTDTARRTMRRSQVTTARLLVNELVAGNALLRAVLSVVLTKLMSLLLPAKRAQKRKKEPTEWSFSDLVDQLPAPTISVNVLSEFDRASLVILLADRLALGSTVILRSYKSLTKWAVLIMAASTIRLEHICGLDDRLDIHHIVEASTMLKFVIAFGLIVVAAAIDRIESQACKEDRE